MGQKQYSTVVRAGVYRDYWQTPTDRFVETERVDHTFAYGEPRLGYPKLLGQGNVGGAFYVYGRDVQRPGTSIPLVKGGQPYKEHTYSGTMHSNIGFPSLPPYKGPEEFGAEAYEKMRPDNAIFAGLNAAYELREIPGMLKDQISKNGLNNIGNWYLAVKFGWEPLLRDIIDFVTKQRKAQIRLAQLIRDEGKPVRRRITLRDEVNLNVVETWQNNAGLDPSFVDYFYGGGHYTTVTSNYDRVWASAQFRTWLPGGPRDINWTRRMLAAIYGARPTPKVIWNAIPWSWLADWFGNLGSMIANLESDVADRQAADYAYVMRWSGTQVRRTHACVMNDALLNTWFPVEVNGFSDSFTKMRTRASPFHPALKEIDLSGTQLAILGALGLSRL